MSETESPDEKPAPLKLREFLGEMIQKAFSEQSAGLGAQIVTDWTLVAEVNNGEHPMLRLVDSGLPLWRNVGLLKFSLMDAEQDLMILNAAEDDD
jgi:hypothetical protein